MSRYIYECSTCKKNYSPGWIEKVPVYLCPECYRPQKNMPLQGVLKIIYDYNFIKTKIGKEDLLNKIPGSFWDYPFLWPLEFDEKKLKLKNITDYKLEKLKLLSSPVLQGSHNNKPIWFFDDTRNPTLSYKDRASVLVALKALQLDIPEISVASTGNAGSSLAGICARLGLKAKVFVPERIPDAKRIQIQSFGADLFIVKGDYDQAFDICLELSEKKNWYNRNTAFNPLTIEGKKSSVFDMFISLRGNLPDNIFVSVGDGVIISGIYKGLFDLYNLGWIKKYPKLIAVQAAGSDGLYRYLKTGIFEYKPADTVADSLSAGAPRNLYLAAEAIKKTNGDCLIVSDKQIVEAQKNLAKNFGLLTEPAASAVFAGYLNYQNMIPPAESVILMLTGNGLKDTNTLASWNKKPTAKKFFR